MKPRPNPTRPRRAAAWLSLALLAVTVAGCAAGGMKGTPFWTEDHEERKGTPEGRINGWPVLYYRDPALSVLWPIFELTDEHLAVWPAFNIDGLDKKKQVYGVLWPICEFDTQSDDHRVFPFLWWGAYGKKQRYRVVFPLYWHRGDPYWDRDGLDSLFPLWLYGRHKDVYELFLPWPLIRRYRYNDASGWHVFPLAANHTSPDGYQRWMLWPFLSQWQTNSKTRHGHAVLPLWYWSSGKTDWRFLSLPWSCGGTPVGSHWQLAPPLFYRRGDKHRSLLVTPLWMQGADADAKTSWRAAIPLFLHRSRPDGYAFDTLLGGYGVEGDNRRWWLLPFASGSSDGKTTNWGAFPLLSRSKTGPDAGEQLFGLLAYRQWDKDSSVHGLFPFYRSERLPENGHEFGLLTLPHWDEDQDAYRWTGLLFHHGGKGGERWTWLAPMLTWFRRDEKKGAWVSAPILGGGTWNGNDYEMLAALGLFGTARNGPAFAHHLLPLYSYRRDAESWRLLTLPWSTGAGPNNLRWHLVPPLCYVRNHDDGGTLITPLWMHGSSKKNDSDWQTLLPLYLRRRAGDESLFVTLLGGWQTDKQGKRWLVYPLLSGGRTDEKTGSIWALAPLIHYGWDEKTDSHHVLPLYYWDGASRTFLSPILARWPNAAGGRTTALVPGLSWYASAPDRDDLWLAGPLAHFSWGEKPGSDHVIPLYYRNRNTGTFASLPLSWWKNERGGRTWLVPPLLSGLAAGKDRKDLWLAGPLAHFSWGEKPGSDHVIPLYYRDHAAGTFISAPVSTWKGSDRTHWLIPPALSMYSTGKDAKDLYAALGLFHERWGCPPEKRRGHCFPFYAYEGDSRFYTGLFGWNNKPDGYFYGPTPLIGLHRGDYSGGWLWPLVSHKRHKETGDLDGGVLWGNYWSKGRQNGSSFFPLYYHRHFGDVPTKDQPLGPGYQQFGDFFFCLPICWYSDSGWVRKDGAVVRHGDREKSMGIFPLARYSETSRPDKDRLTADGNLLWFLFDYRREVRPLEDKPGETSDYVRRRFLWRVWHYEKLNGDVSVDMLPGITYDTRTDGFKKISFLHRAFRYEKSAKGKTKVNLLWRLFRRTHHPGKGTDLDILFIPISRARWSNPPKAPGKGD